jgi:hypothetical protein
MANNKPDKIGKLKGYLYLFGRGAISGVIVVFVLLATLWFLILPLTGFWHLSNSEVFIFLIVALLGSIVLGLPAGGIGGVVVGSIWKAVNAAIIGGVIFALVSLTILFLLIPCPFLGGC